MDGLRDPTGTHRADATSGQLAVFLAGLAELDDWSGRASWALAYIRPGFPAARETRRQLEQSGLLTMTGNSFRLKLQLDRPHPFFALLPLAGYNVQSARFAASPSVSPAAAALKIQLASLVTVGPLQLIRAKTCIRPQHIIADSAATGNTIELSHTGSLWMALAVAKGAWEKNFTLESLTTREPVFQLANGGLSISSEALREINNLSEEMKSAFVSNNIRTDDISFQASDGFLSQEGRDDVRRHLITTFTHQVAVVNRSNCSIFMHDVV